jgi:hypothetical protein
MSQQKPCSEKRAKNRLLTLAPLNKVTPLRGFLSLSLYYFHHSRKRLADALNGAICLILRGDFSQRRTIRGGCKRRALNLRLGFMVNARNNITVN